MKKLAVFVLFMAFSLNAQSKNNLSFGFGQYGSDYDLNFGSLQYSRLIHSGYNIYAGLEIHSLENNYFAAIPVDYFYTFNPNDKFKFEGHLGAKLINDFSSGEIFKNAFGNDDFKFVNILGVGVKSDLFNTGMEMKLGIDTWYEYSGDIKPMTTFAISRQF